MKPILFFIRISTASALLLGCGAALAADEVTLSGEPADHKYSRSEIHALTGQFELSDGREAWIEVVHHELVVTIGTRNPVLLHATRGLNHFASADGALRVDFLSSGNGSVTGIRVGGIDSSSRDGIPAELPEHWDVN